MRLSLPVASSVDDVNDGVPVATNCRSGPIFAPAFVSGCSASYICLRREIAEASSAGVSRQRIKLNREADGNRPAHGAGAASSIRDQPAAMRGFAVKLRRKGTPANISGTL